MNSILGSDSNGIILVDIYTAGQNKVIRIIVNAHIKSNNSKALKDVYCQAVNVPETHSNAFDNSPIENMTLYVRVKLHLAMELTI